MHLILTFTVAGSFFLNGALQGTSPQLQSGTPYQGTAIVVPHVQTQEALKAPASLYQFHQSIVPVKFPTK